MASHGLHSICDIKLEMDAIAIETKLWTTWDYGCRLADAKGGNERLWPQQKISRAKNYMYMYIK